jgi:hypothetical protein
MQLGVRPAIALQFQRGRMVRLPIYLLVVYWRDGLMLEIAIINKDWTRQATISPEGPKSVSSSLGYKEVKLMDRWLVN